MWLQRDVANCDEVEKEKGCDQALFMRAFRAQIFRLSKKEVKVKVKIEVSITSLVRNLLPHTLLLC